MNSILPIAERLTIEVVYDLICPWCYLGVRRLLTTLSRRSDLRTELVWRPFLLNPDMPSSGMTRADYVMRKFGSEERVRRLNHSIGSIGQAEHVDFRFDRIRRAPNSVNAHRLVRHADRQGYGIAVAEALFAAHFTWGRDIGDIGTLSAIAGEQGLGIHSARRYLSSTEDADAIHADNLRAHRLGINGVPCFVVAGRHAIAGAQEPEVLERLLDVAAAEVAEVRAG